MANDNENLIDTKFNEDDKPITSDMIQEKEEPEQMPLEIPSPTPYDQRDIYYTQILANYNTEYKSRRRQIRGMRNIMFWTMLSILTLVVLASIIMFFIMIFRKNEASADIVSIITVAVTFVSTVLTIPIIIARSLFPEKEDNQIIDVLTKLIENDDNIRKDKNNK